MSVDFFENIDKRVAGTIIDELAIEFIETDPDRLVLKMPITPKTHQPAGILHGGISVVLAETAASVGTAINIDLSKKSGSRLRD